MFLLAKLFSGPGLACCVFCSLLGSALPLVASAADTYPARSVRVIIPFAVGGGTDVVFRILVPYPPGGSTDITARTIQSKLAERIGRPVVIENRPGAASQIATQHVARSSPDGNTLLISFDNHSINPIVKPKLPYDTFKDFVGVSLLVRFPLVIAANPSVPGNNLAEFIAAAKKKPGFFSYASTGVGSLNQLAMEDLKRKAGIFVLHVPYGGGGPAIAAGAAARPSRPGGTPDARTGTRPARCPGAVRGGG